LKNNEEVMKIMLHQLSNLLCSLILQQAPAELGKYPQQLCTLQKSPVLIYQEMAQRFHWPHSRCWMKQNIIMAPALGNTQVEQQGNPLVKVRQFGLGMGAKK
jgi:hypothetical protein